MGFWRIIFTIILPPLGVLLGKGLGWAFIINIILTLLGYIPGLIHAFWVQTKSDA
ncbi:MULTISPECIES: YqaE/Pmp3 family membrane protein [Lonsdalea]|uniref:YqaE/Pmp3 family membrane protein n=1 Tax=Lonsdalea populi TaxID=1172565 RepID=A0A3N0UDZ4_9GAMM|nr:MULTISPECIES: YqaE/Pmp3 family membrane protein [Lonsdalea]QPQ23002.1 YqaE/Pmp3 family membrane protein [Lonsdalea populi]ROH77076.1 YqaE/Pmp3 family membrane protein [Lonsdalea populi]ROH78800.1 YqaE/Pmp3 family membrane protein [Lonsdalea populi]ROH78897.1 YqaE/Pmp3 family membrane protein [Lonsdalea populi]